MLRLEGPVRLPQQLSADKNEIRLTTGDDLIGVLRVGDQSHSSRMDLCFIADALGKLNLITSCDGNSGIRYHAAGRDIDQIHSEQLQLSAKNDRLFYIPPSLDPVGCRDSYEEGQFGRYDIAEVTGSRQQKPHAICQAAAIIISAMVA